MTVGDPFGFEVGLGLDYGAAAVFFGNYGITVSTMSGMVRDGTDGPLHLYEWQRSFLRWLEPRLGRAHVTKAKINDLARLKASVSILEAAKT